MHQVHQRRVECVKQQRKLKTALAKKEKANKALDTKVKKEAVKK